MTRNFTCACFILLVFLTSCKSVLINSNQKKEVNTFCSEAEINEQYSQPVIQEPMELAFTPTSFSYPEDSRKEIGIANYPQDQLMLYAEAAKKYAKENGFDTSYIFLANMALLPNKKRFYIIKTDSLFVIDSGLVAHGRGKGRTIYSRQYSNVPGSNCTSLGKYKILKSYNGAYGPSYRLAGLDKTNNNALKRGVVLHASGCILDKENYAPACVSEGCPAVSKKFFDNLTKIMKSKKQPILLWIYDSLLEEPVWVKVKDNAPTFTMVSRQR